jgi:hypothetical protein
VSWSCQAIDCIGTNYPRETDLLVCVDPKIIRLVDYAKLRKTGHCMETMTVRRDWLCNLTIVSWFLDTRPTDNLGVVTSLELYGVL